MTIELESRLQDVKEHGFTVFRGFYDQHTVQAIRDVIEPEFEEIFRADADAIRTKLGAPVEGGDGGGRNAQMGGLLAHPLWPHLEPLIHAPWHCDMLLDFLELLFGPFVQLDAFGITGTPAHAYPIERRGTLVDQGWHRDSSIANRYQTYGQGTPYAGAIDGYATPKYKPPSGVNLLTYLQDATDATGALRIVQRSHLGQPPTPSGEAQREPHPQEQVLDVAAGDLIVMHGECIHAGTCNTSGTLRAYVSTFVTQVGYPHRDDFTSEGAARLLRKARRDGDRRVMRFLGAEDEDALRQLEVAWAGILKAEALHRQRWRQGNESKAAL